MGSFCGSSPQTVTQASTSTNPAIPAQQNNVYGALNSVYNANAGNPAGLVAPLNSIQQTAGNLIGQNALGNQPWNIAAEGMIGQGSNIVGGAPGYFGTGADSLGQGAATLGNINAVGATGWNPQPYLNPYTQDVVDTTQAAFQRQNALDQNNLDAYAIKNGDLFGGDRAGLAKNDLTRQQQTAQAPVIAGLNQANFNQASQQANAQQNYLESLGLGNNQQQLAKAGQYGQLGSVYGNLGSGLTGAGATLGALGAQTGNVANQSQNTTMSGLGAMFNYGTAGQNVAQQQLSSPLTLAQWLSQNSPAVNQAPVTTGTVYPGANPLGTIAGLGLTGLAGYGLYNNIANSGNQNTAQTTGGGSQAPSATSQSADGGRIPRAGGGDANPEALLSRVAQDNAFSGVSPNPLRLNYGTGLSDILKTSTAPGNAVAATSAAPTAVANPNASSPFSLTNVAGNIGAANSLSKLFSGSKSAAGGDSFLPNGVNYSMTPAGVGELPWQTADPWAATTTAADGLGASALGDAALGDAGWAAGTEVIPAAADATAAAAGSGILDSIASIAPFLLLNKGGRVGKAAGGAISGAKPAHEEFADKVEHAFHTFKNMQQQRQHLANGGDSALGWSGGGPESVPQFADADNSTDPLLLGAKISDATPSPNAANNNVPVAGADTTGWMNRLTSNPNMALLVAGLGTLAHAGERDARGLPKPAVSAIGEGAMSGVGYINEQQALRLKQQQAEREAAQLYATMHGIDPRTGTQTMAGQQLPGQMAHTAAQTAALNPEQQIRVKAAELEYAKDVEAVKQRNTDMNDINQAEIYGVITPAAAALRRQQAESRYQAARQGHADVRTAPQPAQAEPTLTGKVVNGRLILDQPPTQ